MKIDKKLKLQGEKPTELLTRGSAPAPRWGLLPIHSFTLAIRARHDPPFGQILDPPLHVGSGSEVPEAEHNNNNDIATICVNQKPRIFLRMGISEGGGVVPLSPPLCP